MKTRRENRGNFTRAKEYVTNELRKTLLTFIPKKKKLRKTPEAPRANALKRSFGYMAL